MTPQEKLRRSRREAAMYQKLAQLSAEQLALLIAVVEKMATGGACFEDALEDVAGVRDIADLPTWTA